ncbi:MAG TPA: hypothetical protein VG963_19565, partial [Polyangiaceae bacterium]|nr:hypothetical protein [Polyangiaceae bacterium]
SCAADADDSCSDLDQNGNGACVQQEPEPGMSSAALNWRRPHAFTVTASVDPSGAGTVVAKSRSWLARCEGSSCRAKFGASLSLQATAASDYQFTGWSGCSDSRSATLKLPFIHGDLACVAHFTPSVVVVSTGVLGMYRGQVTITSPAGCAGLQACGVPYGTTLTLVAPSNSSYRFVSWSSCSDSTDPTLTLVAKTSTTCLAIMEPITSEVSWSVVPEAGGTVRLSAGGPDITCSESSCQVVLGASITIEAVSNSGYRFVGWSGCSDSSEPQLQVTAANEQPQHCEAHFEAE